MEEHKIIKIDKKEYIEYKAYNDLQKKHEELQRNENAQGDKLEELKVKYMDEASVMGIGSFKPKGEWIQCKVSIQLLMNALNSLSWITCNAKSNKDRSISFIFSNNHPLLLGEIDKNSGEASGIILAPRVDNE